MAKAPCVFFKMGTCTKGDECGFGHSSPTAGPPASTEPQKSVRASKTPCHFWRLGTCRRDQSCQYLHANATGVPDENGPFNALDNDKGEHVFPQISSVPTPPSSGVSLKESSVAEEPHSLDTQASLSEPPELHRELDIEPGHTYTERQYFPQKSSVTPTSPASSLKDSRAEGVHSTDTKISLPEPLELYGELSIQPHRLSTEEEQCLPHRSSVPTPTLPASSLREDSRAGGEVHSVDTQVSLPEPTELHGELGIQPDRLSTEEQVFSSVSTPTSPKEDSGAGGEVYSVDTKLFLPEYLELHRELDIRPISDQDSMKMHQILPQAIGAFLHRELETNGTSVRELDAPSEAPLYGGATSVNPCEVSSFSDDIYEVEPLQPEDALDMGPRLDCLEDSPMGTVDNAISEPDRTEIPFSGGDTPSSPLAPQPDHPSPSGAQVTVLHWSEYADPAVDMNIAFCKFFAQARCLQGYNCKFRHSLSITEYTLLFRDSQPTLRSHNTFYPQAAHIKPPISSGLGPCKFYPLGKCRNGNACTYTHTQSPDFPYPLPSQEQFSMSVDPENTPYAPQSNSSTTAPCKFNVEQGSRLNGDSYHPGFGPKHSQFNNGDGTRSDNLGEQTWEDQGSNATGGNSGARTVCKWFREGYCRREKNCRFIHDVAGGDRWDESAETERRVAAPCRWHLQGNCSKGDKCNFIHEQAEDNTLNGEGWTESADDWNNPTYSWGEPPNHNTVVEQEWPERSAETAEPADGPVAEEETVTSTGSLEDPTARDDSTNGEWPVIENDPWSTSFEGQGTVREIRTDEHTPDTSSKSTNAPHETDFIVKENGPEEAQSHGPDPTQNQLDVVASSESSVGQNVAVKENGPEEAQSHPDPAQNQMDVVGYSDPAAESWDWESNVDQEPSGAYKRRAPCKAFGQGYCPFGDSCRYMHMDDTQEQPPSRVEAPPQENIVPQLDTEVAQMPTALGSPLAERALFNCAVCFSSTDECSPVEITSASESRRVLLFNLPSNVEHKELQGLGEQIASVDYIEIEYAETRARATMDFNCTTEAALAAARLDGQIYGGNTLIARLDSVAAESIFQPLACHSVKITWPTPTRFAWVYYPTITIAKNEAIRLNGLAFESRQIKATFHRPRPKQTDAFPVKLTGLPRDAKLESVRIFCVHNSLVTLGDPTYQDDPINSLRDLLANTGYLDSLLVLPANPGAVKQVAFARFSGELSGVMRLHGVAQPFLGGKGSLSIQMVYHANFKVSNRRFRAINGDFEQLCETHKDSCNFHVRDESDPIIIHISSNVTDGIIFGKLNQQLQYLLRGQTVECDDEKLWDEYFDLTSSARAIEKINGDSSFLVEIDNRSQNVRVVGSTIGQQRARTAITRLLKMVRGQRQVIPLLDSMSLQRLLDGAFTTLQSDVGANKVTLDVTVPQLIVRGDEEVLHKVQLAAGTTQLPSEDLAVPTESQICPLCRRIPSTPMALPCDHVYCRACLQHVLRASTGSYFITPRCIAVILGTDDELDVQCSGCIPYPLIHELLTDEEEHCLLRSSFLAYVRDHPDKFFFCPTPNCETLYGRGREGPRYCCPLCSTEVCTWCMTEYHEGLPCHPDDQATRNPRESVNDVLSALSNGK